MDAPIRGQSHQLTDRPDRDFLDGGDGNDLLEGHADLDRILGGSGADDFVAETIEARDIDIADNVDASVPGGDLIKNTLPPDFNPVINVPDHGLRFAIGQR